MYSPVHCIDAIAKVEKTKTKNLLLSFVINKMERLFTCVSRIK